MTIRSQETQSPVLNTPEATQGILALALADSGAFHAGELYAQRLDSGRRGLRVAALCHFLFGVRRQRGLLFWHGGTGTRRAGYIGSGNNGAAGDECSRLSAPVTTDFALGLYSRAGHSDGCDARAVFSMLLLLAQGYHEFSPPPCDGIGHCIEGHVGQYDDCLGFAGELHCDRTLIVTFSAPIATRRARIILLVWFAAVLYSNTSPGPVAAILEGDTYPAHSACDLLQPRIDGNIDWSGCCAVMMAVYVVGLTRGGVLDEARDLLLQ